MVLQNNQPSTLAGQKVNPGAFAHTTSPSLGGMEEAPSSLAFFFPFPFFRPLPLGTGGCCTLTALSVSMHRATSSPEEESWADILPYPPFLRPSPALPSPAYRLLLPCLLLPTSNASTPDSTPWERETNVTLNEQDNLCSHLTTLYQCKSGAEWQDGQLVGINTRQTIPSHLCSATSNFHPWTSHTDSNWGPPKIINTEYCRDTIIVTIQTKRTKIVQMENVIVVLNFNRLPDCSVTVVRATPTDHQVYVRQSHGTNEVLVSRENLWHLKNNNYYYTANTLKKNLFIIYVCIINFLYA